MEHQIIVKQVTTTYKYPQSTGKYDFQEMAALREVAAQLMVMIWPELHSTSSHSGCSTAMLIVQTLRELQLELNIAVITILPVAHGTHPNLYPGFSERKFG